MEIKILTEPIAKKELVQIAKEGFGDMVKGVVDVEQKILAINAELHADIETALMENKDSKREHTWGINLYPDEKDEDWIQFDSLVNIKPAHGNRSRSVEDDTIKEKIRTIVSTFIKE